MAAQCLAMARQASDSGVRASLVEMAQKWLDLAERSEHDEWNEAYVSAPLRRQSAKSFEPSASCHTSCRIDFSPF
jgi:hypothetical protein